MTGVRLVWVVRCVGTPPDLEPCDWRVVGGGYTELERAGRAHSHETGHGVTYEGRPAGEASNGSPATE